MNDSNPWKIVSSRTTYQNPWIKIHEDKVITPTGKPGMYAYMESRDSVIVIVLNEKNEIYLVQEFNYPTKSWDWQLPGGGGDDEDALVASRRELEEETGIRARTWEKLGTTRICNGLMTERMTTYLARDLTFNGHKEEGDEKIERARFFPLHEIDDMAQNDKFDDGQSLAALYLLRCWLDRRN